MKPAQRKIKVLHLIRSLGLGGAETNLLNLAGAFDTERIETHVAYSHGGEVEDRFKAADLRLFKYADGNHRVKSLHTLLITLRLARYIRKQGIDIVHTHNFSGHVWGLLAAKLTGTKIVEHVHDFRYTPHDELVRRHGVLDQYRFTPYLRRRSDRVVVLTRAHRDHVVAHGYRDANQVLEIPNGIPLTTMPHDARAIRRRLKIEPERIMVLTGARMDPSKNIDLILRIAGPLAARVPQILFLIAGSGTHLAEYEASCRQQGLDAHVRFIGFHRDMEELLATADVFLLPSFLELHSIAILEALKMQVPVVASHGVGCNDEFIEHGVNGFLCDPFVDAPWIEVLDRLASDPELRCAAGSAGAATCRRLFDIRDTAARFARLYGDLVA